MAISRSSTRRHYFCPLGDGSSLSAEQGNVLVSRTFMLHGVGPSKKHVSRNFIQVAIVPGKDDFGVPPPALEERSISAGAAADFITIPAPSFSGIMPFGEGGCLKSSNMCKISFVRYML